MPFDLTALIDKLPPLRIPGLHPKEAVGIDLGSFSIKIIQLKGSAEQLELVRWSVIPITTVLEGEKSEPSPEEKKANSTALLRTYRGSGKKIPKNAITSVSGNSIIVRYVKFPKLTPKELEKSIKTEAEPYIPFNIEEVFISVYPFRDIQEEGKAKMETVLVAAKKDYVGQRIEILEGSGFKPVIVDVDAFALETVYESTEKQTPMQETVLIANIGFSKTNFSIVEKGISVVVKDSPIAGNTINKSIMKNLGIDANTSEKLKLSYGLILDEKEKQEALAEGKKEAVAVSDAVAVTLKDLVTETKKIIQYYATQGKDKKVDRMLISGGSANLKNLIPYLSTELKIPAEKLNPFKKISGIEGVPEEHYSSLGIAAGLALRQSESFS